MRDERRKVDDGAALFGSVARDTMDHASMLLRDELEIARLSVRRSYEHLRQDVGPRALWIAAAVVTGGLAVLLALVAIFLGIAVALGSVAWTFAIFAAAFTVAAVAAAGFAGRPRALPTSEIIARQFPAVQAHPTTPTRALVKQESVEAHREVVEEARREGAPGPAPRIQRLEPTPIERGGGAQMSR